MKTIREAALAITDSILPAISDLTTKVDYLDKQGLTQEKQITDLSLSNDNKDKLINILVGRLEDLEVAVQAQQRQIYSLQTESAYPAQNGSARQVNQGKTHSQINVRPSSPNARHCSDCGETKVWGRMGCPSSDCLRQRAIKVSS